MISINEADKKYVLKKIKNAQDMLDREDITALLEAISDYLDYIGFDKNDNFTDEGRTVQAIYDRIYYNN